MDEDESSVPILRLVCALIAGLLVCLVGLFLWYEIKVWSLDTWSEISFFFMPLLIGIAVGWVIHLCSGDGKFGLAGLSAFIAVLAGIEGAALQHQVEVNFFLHRMTALAYDETLNYAKRTAFLQDDALLRKEMSGSEVAVIGRLAVQQKPKQPNDYWVNRNFIHLHWIAARQIIINGQGGPERIIWEASRVLKDRIYLDALVTALAKEPIKETDIVGFYSWEQPFLRQLARGDISLKSFEAPLIETIWLNIGWGSMASGGFGPLIGLFIILGGFAAYKIVRRADDDEMV
jgi:hypothetical protein